MAGNSPVRNLKRQFGKRLVETALKSPTLMADIERIRHEGVRIRLVDGPCRAYYDRKKRTIYIGRWCPRNYKLISIAHEFVHAIIKPTIDPVPGQTGRQEFIDRCLEEETEAIVHEIHIVRELAQSRCQRRSQRAGMAQSLSTWWPKSNSQSPSENNHLHDR